MRVTVKSCTKQIYVQLDSMIFEYKIDDDSFAQDYSGLTCPPINFCSELDLILRSQSKQQIWPNFAPSRRAKAAGQTSHLRGENESEGANGASRYVQSEKYRLPKLFPQKLKLTVLWSSYNQMVKCLVLGLVISWSMSDSSSTYTQFSHLFLRPIF